MWPGLATTASTNSAAHIGMPGWTRARRLSSARWRAAKSQQGNDHRLLFELLIGPIHARILLSSDTLDDVKTTTIVDTVLNGVVASPSPATEDPG
jgi:hypothetical protein